MSAPTPLVHFLLACCQHWYKFRDGGNQFAFWLSFLTFFRHIAKLDLPIYEKFQHYEDAGIHGGPRFMHQKFWIVSDFPECLHRDDRSRPHRTDGPFCRWRDGWEIFRIHGVAVPADVIERPESVTVARIDGERNAEVRRVLLERFGQARYIEESGSKKIHEDEAGQLYRRELDDDEPLVMVRVVNSTPEPVPKDHGFDTMLALAASMGCELVDDRPHKIYWLRVPPETRTAREGVAWTFGLKPEQYQPQAQT